jgi:hypothetical protein
LVDRAREARGAAGLAKEIGMRMMAGLRLFTTVGAISLLGAGAAHAEKEVTRFKSNGAFASHNSSDGTTAYDLAVHVDASTGTPKTTFFAFTTQTCTADFSVCSGVMGNGNIPNGDFNSSNGMASLNTNLATNSGFHVFNYVQDNVNGTFTQTPAVPGIVVINWKKIPRQSQSSKGEQKSVSGGFSNTFKGEQSSDGATATGTLLGTPLPAIQSSFIGMSKASQVIINRS